MAMKWEEANKIIHLGLDGAWTNKDNWLSNIADAIVVDDGARDGVYLS